MFNTDHPHIFADMREHTPAFRAKLIFVASTLFLWGVSLLPFTYLVLYALYASTWNWSYLWMVPSALFGIFVAWTTYGIVLVRFNNWLGDNGFRRLWTRD